MKIERTNDYSAIEDSLVHFQSPFSRTVTIIVTYHEAFPLLRSLLYSLQSQSYPRHLLDIVLIDDGSSPALTHDDLREFSSIPFTIHRIDHHGYRLSTMRNHGVLLARGEIIVCVDQDIIAPRWWIESLARWFHVSDNVAVFGLRKFVDTRMIALVKPIDFEESWILPEIPSISNGFTYGDKRKNEVKMIKNHPFPFNCFHGCNMSFTRQSAIAVGLFDEAFNYQFGYEDIEFGYRLWQSGIFIVYEPNATVIHQENFAFEDKNSKKRMNLELLYSRVAGLREFREMDIHIGPR